LQRVLEEAQRKPKPFDILLVDDTSRLSRKLSDALRTIERLEFAGIRVVFVSQGFDSSSAQAQTLVAVHGLIDGVYLEELRQKTRRGVEQLHIEGKHTGGRVFGYRHRPIEDPTRLDVHGRPAICGVKLEVNPLQASIIRRIFQEYANGRSMKAIAVGLNHSRIASPQPQKGRISQSWCQSSIRHILLNERYRGIVNWGRTKKVRDPQTGKRICRRKPPSEWLRK
jgi:DNA invertase Pin-like site-specific DNA recombinase